MREKDIGHVGTSEVRLDLMDRHLKDFLEGKNEIRKPLVYFEEDRISEEVLDLEGVKVAIAEGTYTTALDNVKLHVFIDRTYEDTRTVRARRAREAQDDFLEKILEIEHRIISANKARTQILVTGDYEARENKGP